MVIILLRTKTPILVVSRLQTIKIVIYDLISDIFMTGIIKKIELRGLNQTYTLPSTWKTLHLWIVNTL